MAVVATAATALNVLDVVTTASKDSVGRGAPARTPSLPSDMSLVRAGEQSRTNLLHSLCVTRKGVLSL